jgi:tetratricopeptide (TPR) repeat protein
VGAKDEAVEQLLTALAIPADKAAGMAALGRQLIEAEDFAAAAVAFAMAARAKDRADYWSALGFCEQKQNRLDAAVVAYRRAISAGGDDVQLWANLGEAYLDLFQYAPAAEALGKAMALDPNGDHPASMRARALVLKAVRDMRALQDKMQK